MTTNVYMVMEDGESRIYAAPSMARAIEAAWQQNLADESEGRDAPFTEEEARAERREWEDTVLQSVTLVGELENVDDLRVALRPAFNVTGEPLVDRLRKAAQDLYGGESTETMVDPIACLLEAADSLERLAIKAGGTEP